MIKTLTVILLALTISSCATKTKYIYLTSPVEIPEHHTLPALTQSEVAQLDPEVRRKIELMRAMLIANIKALENNIRVHNKNAELPLPDT